MTFYYIFPHLILAGLVGIHCQITTVSKVPVKAGVSISVPCLYEQKYSDYVKYLCKGRLWPFCKTVTSTNQQPCSGRFCISDDTKQRIFTVTIDNLTDGDKHFWCAVELSGPDVHQGFELSVTTEKPSLYVSQKEITGHEGGSVTVLCHYNYKEDATTSLPQWCRLGSSCVTAQTGSIDQTTLEINASAPNVFNVTMSELRTSNSGWYWCASEDLQIPVHLTVHELTSTTTPTTLLRPKTTGTSTTHQTCFLLSSTETHAAPVANATVNGTGSGSPQDEHQSFIIGIVTAALVLALVVVPATYFGWRTIMHHKSKPEVRDINVGTETPDSDVPYATIVHNQHGGTKTKDCIPLESVTYSTIVLKDNMQQMAEPADRSVIYSTIKHNKP